MSTTETAAQTLLARPKRADARRNYEKVLAAAREAFAEGGESTSLEEIARRAGVGIGTLYRHFPNRQALLEALYVDEVEEICRSAAELDGADPWEALNGWFERFIALHRHQAGARRRAAQLPRPRTPPLFQACRTSLFAAGEPLLKRAQEAGVVRPDVDIGEVIQMVDRDRQDPGRATPSRPSTSCASRSTACATAPTSQPWPPRIRVARGSAGRFFISATQRDDRERGVAPTLSPVTTRGSSRTSPCV